MSALSNKKRKKGKKEPCRNLYCIARCNSCNALSFDLDGICFL